MPNSRRVLLVDRNPVVTRELPTGFRAYGYDCRVAMALAQATAVIATMPVALIVTEVDLGDGNAFGLLAASRSTAARVVVLSNERNSDVYWQLLNCGACNCLAKPATPRQILQEAALPLGPGSLQDGGPQTTLQEMTDLYVEYLWQEAPTVVAAARILGVNRRTVQRLVCEARRREKRMQVAAAER